MHASTQQIRFKTIMIASVGLAALIGLSAPAGTVQAGTTPLDTLFEQRLPVWRDGTLTAEQAALWQEIQEARQANIQQLQRLLESTAESLNQDSEQAPDMGVLTQTTESAVDELIGEMRLNRDRYLALYAQLTPEQQTEVREKLAQDLERLSSLLSLLELVR